MNKLLSEVVRGCWMISDEEANALLPVVQKILSGDKFDEKTKNYNLKFFDLNQETVFISNDGWDPTDLTAIPKGSTAVIPINGVLTKYDNCGYYGMQSLAALVMQLADNPNIDAIVQHVDSPGGNADGSYDLAQAFAYARTKKPVVTYVDGMMASAAYRSGMNADLIVTKPGSIVGSIGTMFSAKIVKRADVEEITVNADTSPQKNLAFENLKNGDTKLIKESLLNPMNQIFIDEVKALRPDASVDALEGATFVGKAAKKAGLIDKEGTLQTALLEAQKLTKQRQKLNSNTTKMSFKTKFPGIASFLGMTDETAENKETLTAEEIQSLETLAGVNARLQAEIATQKTTISEKEAAIVALQKERDEWKTKAEEFGAQPGAIGAIGIENTAGKKYNFDHVKESNVKAMLEKEWNGTN